VYYDDDDDDCVMKNNAKLYNYILYSFITGTYTQVREKGGIKERSRNEKMLLLLMRSKK